MEGGRNSIRRFEQSLVAASEEVRQRFYLDSFVDLMGRGLDGVPDQAAAAR